MSGDSATSSTWLDAVYTRHDKAGLVYGTSVDDLAQDAAAGLTIDWRAWACQFCFGYPLGSRTHFAEISMRRLGSSGKQGEANLGSAWREHDDSHRVADFAVAAAGVADLLLSSVARALARNSDRSPFCISGSSASSRLIAACLQRLVPRGFRALTFDNDGSEQHSSVAGTTELDHRMLALRDEEHPLWTHEALLAADYTTNISIRTLQSLSTSIETAPTLYLGSYGGDLLLGGHLQKPGDDARAPDDDEFYYRFAQSSAATVLSGPVSKTFERLARDELARELGGYPTQDRTLRFLLANSCFRAAAHSARVRPKGTALELPFLDLDLLRFVLSVDQGIRLSSDFAPAVLNRLDERLSRLPSASAPGQAEASGSRQAEPFNDTTVDWFLANIRNHAGSPSRTGGVIDWFSVEPARLTNRSTDASIQQKRHRALEMLNAYSLWLTRYSAVTVPSLLSYALNEGEKRPSPILAARPNVDYREIAERYRNRARKVEGTTLRFHITIDVEAFPPADAYAYHTASADLIRGLIYADMGHGSDIERLLLRQQIPCTFFLETFSPAWPKPSAVAEAARFFKRGFTELGLHCHAFSLPDELREELELDADWFMEPKAVGSILRRGKLELEAAIGNTVRSYRSGRLDIYPGHEGFVAEAGFTIDSSLADGRSGYYYSERSSRVGNALHRRGSLIEIPVSTYRTQRGSQLLDFNGSSFEELCFVVVRALELGETSLTMLMHSWSLSDVQEQPLLSKGFHYQSSPTLHEKLERLLDFLCSLGSVKLSTLGETAQASLDPPTLPSFFPELLEFDPSPLQVVAWRDGDSVVGRCDAAKQIAVEPEFAFYLMVNGSKVAERWYRRLPTASFPLPQIDELSAVEIIGFVRDSQNPGQPQSKRVRLIH